MLIASLALLAVGAPHPALQDTESDASTSAEPAASTQTEAPAEEHTRTLGTVTAELGTWAVVSRASLQVEVRVVSLADNRLTMAISGGVGLLSFYVGPAKVDAHAALVVITGRGAHHATLKLGPDVVSNTVVGDGPWIWPLIQAGYRYHHPDSPLVIGGWLGTNGLSVEVGRSF